VALALDEEAALRHLLPPPAERRAIRLAAGVAAARVAAELGVTGQCVRWWERGRSEPSAVNLAAYVAVLARLAAWAAQPGEGDQQ
jgi:DNA-binding transcriptional regulator YiaG